MRNPTTPQRAILAAARANNGRLPSGAFAHAGVFCPSLGTEAITDVLTRAARARNIAQAEQTLLTSGLTHLQMLIAGGILGVERDRHDGIGDLAEKYADNIKNNPDRLKGVTVSSLHACIRNGWLTDRWELTDDGSAAIGAQDDLAPIVLVWAEEPAPADERADFAAELVHAASANAANPVVVVTDEVHNAFTAPAAGRGEGGKPDTAHRLLTYAMATNHRHAPTILDPKASLPAQLPALDDVRAAFSNVASERITGTIGSGKTLTPETHARLNPAVNGKLADRMISDLTQLRDAITARLAAAGQIHVEPITADPRAPGYRVLLLRARIAGGDEAARMALMYFENALNQIERGAGKVAAVIIRRALHRLSR